VVDYLYSGVTDGGGGGKCPPGSSDGGPFSEMGPINSASLLPKQFYKFKPLFYTSLFLLLQ